MELQDVSSTMKGGSLILSSSHTVEDTTSSQGNWQQPVRLCSFRLNRRVAREWNVLSAVAEENGPMRLGLRDLENPRSKIGISQWPKGTMEISVQDFPRAEKFIWLA